MHLHGCYITVCVQIHVYKTGLGIHGHLYERVDGARRTRTTDVNNECRIHINSMQPSMLSTICDLVMEDIRENVVDFGTCLQRCFVG